MLSLTPFFDNTYAPALYSCKLYDFPLDDLARMHSIINDAQAHHRQPNYSLEENDQHAVLQVELPGVAKENISVDLTGRRLVITAKRFGPGQNAETTEAGENGKDGEDSDQPKPSVMYELKLRMGHKYDTDNIQASMDGDGILNMTIPMKKSDGPRNIQIQ